MNGLVSGYGSDSEEEASANPTTRPTCLGSAPKKDNGAVKSTKKDWMECVDKTSGYPYYWNRETNEVKWDRPSELPPISTSAPLPKKPNCISNQHASNNTAKNDISSISKISKVSTIETKKVKKKSRSATPPQVFIGPTLPQLTPEEVARGKVIKFEESMAQEIQKDILKEEPLDWVKSKVHRGLYSKPFAWKKSAPCTSTYNEIQAALKKSKESISLIAGNYADDSETDEDAESPSPNAKKKNRQGVHVKVQKPTSKQAKPLLKEIPGIFKANDDSDDENENINATGDNESDGKSDDQPPKKKGRWDMKDRLCFGKMCLKLEALEVAKIPISPLKLLAVQVETLFAAWQNGALSNSYLQTTLEKLSNQMADIENHHLAPPGWRAVWDRYAPLSVTFLFSTICAFLCIKNTDRGRTTIARGQKLY